MEDTLSAVENELRRLDRALKSEGAGRMLFFASTAFARYAAALAAHWATKEEG